MRSRLTRTFGKGSTLLDPARRRERPRHRVPQLRRELHDGGDALRGRADQDASPVLRQRNHRAKTKGFLRMLFEKEALGRRKGGVRKDTGRPDADHFGDIDEMVGDRVAAVRAGFTGLGDDGDVDCGSSVCPRPIPVPEAGLTGGN